jgi:hypothetical protein
MAYLVKLNIEITMANLIKRIAISTSHKTGIPSFAEEFKSSSDLTLFGPKTGNNTQKSHPVPVHELASCVSYTGDARTSDRIPSLAPTGNQIKATREVVISHGPNPFHARRGSEVEIVGNQHGKGQHTVKDESDDDTTLVE